MTADLTSPIPLSTFDPYAKGDTFDPGTVRWITHLDEVRRLIDAIELAAEVVIDLETTGLDEHATGDDPSWPESARISLASLTLPRADDQMAPDPPTFVMPLSHPESPLRGHWRQVVRIIAQTLADHAMPLTNQNLKFDMKWMHAICGVDLSHLLAWDTQISSHLLDEESSTSLKERAPATFGVRRWDDHDLTTPAASEKVPLFDLGLYAARDTYWTWRLAVLHRAIMGVGPENNLIEPEGPDEIEDRRLGQLAVWCAMPTVATLTAIEQRGWTLDVDWVHATQADLRRETDQSQKFLLEQVRLDSDRDPSFAPTSLWFAEYTEACVEQGHLRVAAMTGTGKPQWSKAVLIRQAREGSLVAQALLDYRQASKRLEFLQSWLDNLAPDGKIHCTYHAGRVVTGRLSATDPNMQQVTYALKPAFVPREGYLIADLDYSQIEMRGAAHIARCVPMLEAFRQKRDLHAMLAATITGQPEHLLTPEQRQGGKAGNFGFLYGMEAQGFQTYAEATYGVYFTEAQAQDAREAFFDQWDGMAKWHVRAVHRAEQTGRVVSPIGRVRRVPGIWDGNPGVSGRAERVAINAPVQGFASDLMQIAAASIEGNLPGYQPVPDVFLVGTVHDSIVAEVPADNWQRATGRMMRRMLDLNPVLTQMGCSLDVPLAVEAKIGTRWGLADVGIIR